MEGGSGPSGEDRIGKELVAKIGAQNALIVAESVRGVLAQERAAADQRLQEERSAADRRLQDERAAGDQRLAAVQASAAAMADRARVDAVAIATAQVAAARTRGQLATVVIGGLALAGGLVIGAVLAWTRLVPKPLPIPETAPAVNVPSPVLPAHGTAPAVAVPEPAVPAPQEGVRTPVPTEVSKPATIPTP